MTHPRYGWSSHFMFSLAMLVVAGVADAQEADSLAVERDVEYGKAGERSLKLDIVRSTEASKDPLPAIVFIHGGGWSGGDKSGGLGRLVPWVKSGHFVGFTVGYRLTGEAGWPAQIHDCKAAIRWVRTNAKKYNIDPERIGVCGTSAGGHLVSLLGTSGDVSELEGKNGTPDVSSRVTCVINFCGPSDFPSFEANDTVQNLISKLLGGGPKEKPEAAKEASPTTYVTKDDPPFLTLHGSKDELVPLQQAELLQEKLTAAGVNSTLVVIDGGGHGFGGPEVEKRVANFFDKHLRGQEVEVSGEPIKAK